FDRAIQMWSAVLLQLLFGSVLLASEVMDRCEHLVNGSVSLNRVCRNTINEEVYVKTRSWLMKRGDPFTLFIDDSQNILFITVKESMLHSCPKLVVLKKNQFKCSDGESTLTIQLKESRIYCFPYHLYIGDLVMDSCDVPRLEQHKQIVSATTQGVLQFSLDQKSQAVNAQLEMLKVLLTLFLIFGFMSMN
ncbi:hypothetical protein KR093_001604, partial [Drosophila rubida]